jgi:hypothetical protein
LADADESYVGVDAVCGVRDEELLLNEDGGGDDG